MLFHQKNLEDAQVHDGLGAGSEQVASGVIQRVQDAEFNLIRVPFRS